MAQTWGSWLRAIRNQLGITQERAVQMCRDAGVQVVVSTWRTWENETRSPSVADAQFVAGALRDEAERRGDEAAMTMCIDDAPVAPMWEIRDDIDRRLADPLSVMVFTRGKWLRQTVRVPRARQRDVAMAFESAGWTLMRGVLLPLENGYATVEEALGHCAGDEVVVSSPAGFHPMGQEILDALSDERYGLMERYKIDMVAHR